MRVDQDMAMRLYSQPTQTRNASAVAAAADKQVTDAAANKDAEKKPDVDRVELSSDAKVTSKMSDSERAALVKSLKDDLNNQMSRFTNMMVQNFQKLTLIHI